MVGARIIVASEAEEGSALNTSLIKEMTGGDAIRARFLYGKEFEFRPVAKFFFATNAIPNIYESTEAIWDRVHCIPFSYRVPEAKVDKMLGLKLRGELDAIFTQAVRWCTMWQALGNLVPPAKVVKSVSHLREEMDVFGEWLAEQVESSPDARTLVAEAYNDYRGWLERTRGKGMRPQSKIALVRYLANHGISVEPGTDNVKFFKGLALRVFKPRV
jgi:putative DNA primase/helicase